VHSIRAVHAKFRYLIHEAARFGVVGLAGLVVTDGGANLLHYQVGMGKITSTAIAILASIPVTFAGSRYWTFRHRERQIGQMPAAAPLHQAGERASSSIGPRS
jgi:putative flippase GtrA